MAAYEVLVTLKLDSGDKSFSVSGLQDSSGYYEQRLLELSPIEQALSLVPDEFRQSEVSVTLDDSDQYMSTLRATESFYGRTLEIKLGDADLGASTFTTVFSGQIIGWRKSGTTFSVSAASAFQRLFEQTVTPAAVVSHSLFPSAPEESLSRLIPLIAGTLDSIQWLGMGAVEPIPVEFQRSDNEDEDGLVGKYAVAQGPLSDGASSMRVLRVWIEDENARGDTVLMSLPSSQWTQAVELFGGIRVLRLTVTYTKSLLGRRVTCDVRGLRGYSQPSVTSSATTLVFSDNPLANLRRFLHQQGSLGNRIADSSWDRESSFATESQLDALSVRGYVWCTERDRQVRDVIDDFARSTNVTLYVSKEGKIASTIPRPGVTSAAAVTIGPDRTIGDSLELGSPEKVASTLDYSYRYVPATGQYEGTSEFQSGGQATALGRDIRADVQFPFVTEQVSAGAVAEIRAFFMREQRIECSLKADAKLYLGLNVGDDVKLTHYAGLGLTGFSDRLFRVIGLALQVDSKEIVTAVRLVDVSEAVAPPRTAFGSDYRPRPPRMRRDGTSR